MVPSQHVNVGSQFCRSFYSKQLGRQTVSYNLLASEDFSMECSLLLPYTSRLFLMMHWTKCHYKPPHPLQLMATDAPHHGFPYLLHLWLITVCVVLLIRITLPLSPLSKMTRPIQVISIVFLFILDD